MGRLCPHDNTKLIKRKAATDLVRLGNYFFDIIILRVLAFPVFFIIAIVLLNFGIVEPDSFNEIEPSTDLIVSILYVFLYYFVFESIFQRTLGKLITGTKVVDFNGRKPTLGMIAKRTLIRFIPFEAFSFPGKKAYGWHDRWSETYVVKAKRFGGKKITAGISALTVPIQSEEGASQQQEHIEQAINQNDETKISSQEVKSDQELSTQEISLGTLGVCENCDGVIGKLEHSYNYKGHVVCVQCYKRLVQDI